MSKPATPSRQNHWLAGRVHYHYAPSDIARILAPYVHMTAGDVRNMAFAYRWPTGRCPIHGEAFTSQSTYRRSFGGVRYTCRTYDASRLSIPYRGRSRVHHLNPFSNTVLTNTGDTVGITMLVAFLKHYPRPYTAEAQRVLAPYGVRPNMIEIYLHKLYGKVPPDGHLFKDVLPVEPYIYKVYKGGVLHE